MRIEIKSDGLKVNGPKVDGSFTLTFNIGEYEQLKLAQLMTIPQNTELNIIVDSDYSDKKDENTD